MNIKAHICENRRKRLAERWSTKELEQYEDQLSRLIERDVPLPLTYPARMGIYGASRAADPLTDDEWREHTKKVAILHEKYIRIQEKKGWTKVGVKAWDEIEKQRRNK